MGRLVINGDEVYELDEECMREKKGKDAKGNVRQGGEDVRRRKNQEMDSGLRR